jgi:hypothetical protein
MGFSDRTGSFSSRTAEDFYASPGFCSSQTRGASVSEVACSPLFYATAAVTKDLN